MVPSSVKSILEVAVPPSMQRYRLKLLRINIAHRQLWHRKQSARVEKEKLSEVYRGERLLNSQYNSPLLIEGRVLGIDGREDAGLATLRAFDPIAREEIWAKAGVPTSHLIGLGKQMMMVSVDGSIALIDALADEYAR